MLTREELELAFRAVMNVDAYIQVGNRPGVEPPHEGQTWLVIDGANYVPDEQLAAFEKAWEHLSA